MDDLISNLQKGGSTSMELINQSGGHPALREGAKIFTPVIFFFGYWLYHHFLDDERAEKEDPDDEDDDSRDFILWEKLSIKGILLMMGLCYALQKVGAFAMGDKGHNVIYSYWWTIFLTLMIISGVWTILAGGNRATAYDYMDGIFEKTDRFKNACIEFRCGYAPHGISDGDIVRGREDD
tara:strand:+ start:2368 stop:2907 length:540 start_codon:yes stop_codon:yes gene_type:complete